jgi:hypothetical protein
MRIYIIGNDGITLCREAPTARNDGEIAVASNEELDAARLSAKRLLALWNALPRRRKAQEGRRPRRADRSALVSHRGIAGPGCPVRREMPIKAGCGHCDAAATRGRHGSTGWQAPPAGSGTRVRGVFSGTLKKKLGLTLALAAEERGRVYRIAAPQQA